MFCFLLVFELALCFVGVGVVLAFVWMLLVNGSLRVVGSLWAYCMGFFSLKCCFFFGLCILVSSRVCLRVGVVCFWFGFWVVVGCCCVVS